MEPWYRHFGYLEARPSAPKDCYWKKVVKDAAWILVPIETAPPNKEQETKEDKRGDK